MSASLSDLALILKAVDIGIDRYSRFPAWLNQVIREKLSDEEAAALNASLKKMFASYNAGKTDAEICEAIENFLGEAEILHGYFERAIPKDELYLLYPVDGLEEKHVKILREMSLPKLAQAIEDGIAARAAGPKTPYSFKDLATIARAVKICSSRFLKYPEKFCNAVFDNVSEEERERYCSTADRISRLYILSEDPLNTDFLVEYLKNHEQLNGIFEKTLTAPQISALYPESGLSAKYFKIMREIGLEKMANVLEENMKPKKYVPREVLFPNSAPKKPARRRSTAPCRMPPA